MGSLLLPLAGIPVHPSFSNAQRAAVKPAQPDSKALDHLALHLSHLAQASRYKGGENDNFKITHSGWQRLLKRVFDVALAVLLLIALAPVLILLALLVKRDGGPAFFRQQRVGRNRKLFTCYKFRSMHTDAEKILDAYLAGNQQAAWEWKYFQKLKTDIRITTFGQFIRRTSLDELPQLINVLKGDMSFVGPRPCTPDQTSFYADDFRIYEAVRPGITGPWQVGGRNRLTFQQRVALETDYVRNWSLALDISILLKTIPTVLRKDGVF